MKVKSESEVAQSCPTLSDPMDCSLPDSSIHGISQARVLEWGAIALSLCNVWQRIIVGSQRDRRQGLKKTEREELAARGSKKPNSPDLVIVPKFSETSPDLLLAEASGGKKERCLACGVASGLRARK